MKKGIAASKGYAIGKVFIKENTEIKITDDKISDVEKEKEILQKALDDSKAQIEKLKEKALVEMGKDKKTVSVTNPITPVCAMAKLYMTVIIQ